jgi:hypothetical protein
LIPLAIITARIADENRIESFCMGADDFIAKPFTPDRIFQAVEQAVHWSNQSGSVQIRNSVSFDQNDDGEILRRIAQLRNLLFARTALSMEEVAEISRAVDEVRCETNDWARGHPGDHATTLTYTFTARQLILEFFGPAGWLGRILPLVDDPTKEASRTRFDQVLIAKSDHSVKFVRAFPAT